MLTIEPFAGPPDKNRLIACLRGEPTDRVPHFEALIEDQHVEKLLGRKAGNTLAVGGDPAKGSDAAGKIRPMHAKDYMELCRIIGQDLMIVEHFWTPLKQRLPDGTSPNVACSGMLWRPPRPTAMTAPGATASSGRFVTSVPNRSTCTTCPTTSAPSLRTRRGGRCTRSPTAGPSSPRAAPVARRAAAGANTSRPWKV